MKLRNLFFLLLFVKMSFFAKDNIIYVHSGCMGNMFGNRGDNQYKRKHFHDLKIALQKLGYQIKQVSSFDNLSNVAAIVSLDVPLNQLRNLQKYPMEKRILFLWEPPTVKAYNYEKKYHKYFSKVYTLLDEFVDNKKYFKFYDPQSSFDYVKDSVAFEDKKLCVMLTRKMNRNHYLSLTSERYKIINFFNTLKSDEFDLYGKGWSKKDCSNYKGFAPSRPQCCKHYKFVFCYENARDLKGYITSHKIIFPMIARSVPIRWSEANVEGHIPKNCFISREDFENYEDLYQYIKNMLQVKVLIIFES
ncbi:unnamed protein product [marine sediment metagenome]|uniref:Fucosyltransferase C-terminal domain-containing protein n=1 Tax=marine sediment metagenome TaxID=412755 RepID=X1U664_9ZZZZ